MFKLIIILFFLLTSNLFALDSISLNFHNLEDDGSWAYDAQTIKNNERAGTSDYSGGSTITNKWNNILAESADLKSGSENAIIGESVILDSNGDPVAIDLKLKSVAPSWNNANKNQPGMVGIGAWPRMIVKDAISLSGINSYADKYDLIFYISYQKESGFTSGALSIGNLEIPFTKENQVIICENFTGDTLTVNLTNRSRGVNKGGVFIGGMQIIKK
jgi:hypothetical protein